KKGNVFSCWRGRGQGRTTHGSLFAWEGNLQTAADSLTVSEENDRPRCGKSFGRQGRLCDAPARPDATRRLSPCPAMRHDCPGAAAPALRPDQGTPGLDRAAGALSAAQTPPALAGAGGRPDPGRGGLCGRVGRPGDGRPAASLTG